MISRHSDILYTKGFMNTSELSDPFIFLLMCQHVFPIYINFLQQTGGFLKFDRILLVLCKITDIELTLHECIRNIKYTHFFLFIFIFQHVLPFYIKLENFELLIKRDFLFCKFHKEIM